MFEVKLNLSIQGGLDFDLFSLIWDLELVYMFSGMFPASRVNSRGAGSFKNASFVAGDALNST